MGADGAATGGLRLGDPDAFLDGVPFEELAELRRSTPVLWQDLDGQPGFWAVLRHADVVTVARRTDVFSASLGGIVVEDMDPETLEMVRGMLLAMDPPRHNVYRTPLADTFRAAVMATLEPTIRSICREIMERAAEQVDVEFVHDVTSALPTRVIGQLMGVPEADWDRLHELAQQQAAGQDPDLAGDADLSAASIEMAMYAIEFAAERRAAAERHPDAEPPADLTTLVLAQEFDGVPMNEIDFGSFFVQLVTAGNDTSRTMLSSGLQVLLEHPEQLEALRGDPTGIPVAVEEILRYANPLHYFRRTATCDTELGGVAIAAGDKVAMYYTSANRDELVFDQPERFDVTRSPNPHLSFGIGSHFCLGVHLARLEGRVFFEELLAAFPEIELAGPPVRIRSNLNNGLKQLPVRLVR